MDKKDKEKIIKHLTRGINKKWDEAKSLNERGYELAEQHSLGMATAYALMIKYIKRLR